MKPIKLITAIGIFILFASFGYPPTIQDQLDDNLLLGNPSKASSDETSKFNYLMEKTGYVLSYNDSLGYPNWVSWHLSTSWLGDEDRCDCFTKDNSLPDVFRKVGEADYNAAGFDRGHLCPSADRSQSDFENAETFLMTNMHPQAPNLNRITWKDLEAYSRKIVIEKTNPKECFIIAGAYGRGGEAGKDGTPTATINGGKINVPAFSWKVIVILPEGEDDLNRISATTRVIAVKMPNKKSVSTKKWWEYRVSVDELETLTGYDFLSNVSSDIQKVIEARTDTVKIK